MLSDYGINLCLSANSIHPVFITLDHVLQKIYISFPILFQKIKKKISMYWNIGSSVVFFIFNEMKLWYANVLWTISWMSWMIKFHRHITVCCLPPWIKASVHVFCRWWTWMAYANLIPQIHTPPQWMHNTWPIVAFSSLNICHIQ